MKTASMGFLKNNARHDRYHEPSDVRHTIKYGLRQNTNLKNDLITRGGIGVIEFPGAKGMADQFYAVQKMYKRKGDFGRHIDHEIFSLTHEAERLIYENSLDIDAIAREMAYDFYEKDHCQVIYDVHRPSENKAHMHIHFHVNTVNFLTGHKRRENKQQTMEREARFNQIVENAVREGTISR